MNEELTTEEEDILHALAEKAVTIQKGEKIGRWTREDRVMVVYSALCSIMRLNKRKAAQKRG